MVQIRRELRALLDTRNLDIGGTVLTVIIRHRAPKSSWKEGQGQMHLTHFGGLQSPLDFILLMASAIWASPPHITPAGASGPAPTPIAHLCQEPGRLFLSSLMAGLLLIFLSTPPDAGILVWIVLGLSIFS